MQKTVKERVTEVIKENNETVNSLHSKIGIPQKTLNNQINGDSSLSLDTILAIFGYFKNISLQWILKGEGEKYIDSSNPTIEKATNRITNEEYYPMTNEPISEYLPTSNFKLLPVHSFDVVGGSNNQESDTMGYIMGYMPFVNAKDGDISVLVTGNSMYPTYPSGAYIQIRRIDYWRDFLEFGQVHIIELMDDRRLIKEVRKGSDKNHFKLISHNANFDEVEVPTEFIRSVWLVLAKYEKSTM